MARYIDADALSIYFDALIKHAEMEGLYNMAHVYERCLQIVKDAPTADVAPRAELAREILQETRQAVLSLVLANAMGENFDLEKRFSEIEKKYTEAEPPKGEKHDPN